MMVNDEQKPGVPNRQSENEEIGRDAPPEDDGIIREIGDLPPGALVSEECLARIFGRHPISIKRAVERGELPPPTRLFGNSVWTAKAILCHIEGRLAIAKKEAEQNRKKIQELRP